MADDNQLIKCPSCGHENAPYVDKCILCDYALARYVNEAQKETQRMRDMYAKKQLGPLPESDLLVDKHKKKRTETSQILRCSECGQANRAGTLMCSNCGARLEAVPISPNSQLQDMRETQDEIPIYEDEPDTQSVPEPDIDANHPIEMPSLRSPQTLEQSDSEIPTGCYKFTSWMILHLSVIGFDTTPIVLRPLEDKPLLIGRRHESLPVQPHIDLTPYLTDRHGVSRRHALLRLRGNRLELQDLNSTNGTSINNVRFSPKESHQVRHQDIIQLGQVKMQVNFAKHIRSAQFGNTEELM